MAAFPLFRDTNMAAVTSRENTLFYSKRFQLLIEVDLLRSQLVQYICSTQYESFNY